MSGSKHDDLLAVPFVVLSDAVRKHRAASPDEQAETLAYLGGMIVGVGANLAIHVGPHARDFSTSLKLGFAAAMLWGVALIVTGWRRRGQRNIGGAVTAILVPGIGYYLAFTYVPGVFHFWWVQTLCTGIIVANLISAAVCLAGPSTRAFDLVVEDIANNDWRW